MKEKEDSGFGFKDKAKAEETLRLLEEHDPGYRRLTVRGLLGRAKRVLSLTKAEDKIKNIKEAMEVFENWLAELDQNKEKKPEKKERKEEKKAEKKKDSSSDDEAGTSEKPELPPEGVSGLGFKDATAARASLEALEGRDPDYQLLAVKGLLGRAKRVLTLTKDESKLSDIKSAMEILEQFTREYESTGMAARNYSWLRVGFVSTAHAVAETVTDQNKAFLSAYLSVRGEHKRLRNVTSPAGETWDRVRNKALQLLREKHAKAKMFNDKDEPTQEHLEMILWAYSPDANRLKKVFKETEEEKPEKMDVDEGNGGKSKETQDGGDKKKESGKKQDRDDTKEEKRRDSDEKKKEERRSDRKRRSSARSDDESHSKKRKD